MADGSYFPRRHANRSLDRLRRQIVHATMYSPLWRAWISRGGEVPFVGSTEDFENVPIVEPAMLRRVSPWALVPAGQRTGLAKSFPSPGPDGTPTWSFWSPNDWRCMVRTLAEALAPYRPPGGDLIAYNAHPVGFVSGDAYGDALRLLDVAVAPRHCDATRPAEVVHEIASLGGNVLVLGHGDRSPETDSGVALDRLLSERPYIFEQLGIKWWICTSSVLGRAHLDAARRQGVQSVTRMYGSSEAGLFAVACPHSLRDYHVTSGHVHVEVVDEAGCSVGRGDRGRVVVTRFGGMTSDGSITVNEGSQLIRMAVGDIATWDDEPCTCGSLMPRLRDVRRELGRGQGRASRGPAYHRGERKGKPAVDPPAEVRLRTEAVRVAPRSTQATPGPALREPVRTPSRAEVRVIPAHEPSHRSGSARRYLVAVPDELAGTDTIPLGEPVPVRTGLTQSISIDDSA